MYAEELVKLIRTTASYKGTSIAERQLYNMGLNAACEVVMAKLPGEPVSSKLVKTTKKVEVEIKKVDEE